MKNNSLKGILILSLSLLMIPTLQAQVGLELEVRPRTEFRNGYKNSQSIAGQVPEFVTSQRTSLGVSFGGKVNGYVNVRDVRTWGEETVKKDNPGLFIKEAWMEVPLAPGWTVKAGRQELKYDDQRILAATNWNQVGTSHDVAIVKFKADRFQHHLGLAYNNETGSSNFESWYPLPYYKALIMAWFQFKIGESTQLSLLGVNDINAKDSTTHDYFSRYTYGGTLKIKPMDALNINATAFLQQGLNTSGKKVNAHLVSVLADWSFAGGTGLSLGTDLFSGNDPNTPSETDHVFNKLYGAVHKYLGYMDYFPSSKHGILDLYGGLELNPFDKSTLSLILHRFELPHAYTHPTDGTQLDRTLGTEFDIELGFDISDNASFGFIHAILWGTPTMDVVKGGEHETFSNFAMVMITWKPSYKWNATE
ncbi:MAG: alginate export family protein [Bacteroidales bacterium]